MKALFKQRLQEIFEQLLIYELLEHRAGTSLVYFCVSGVYACAHTIWKRI